MYKQLNISMTKYLLVEVLLNVWNVKNVQYLTLSGHVQARDKNRSSLHLLSPVGPGGDAEQVDREARLAVGRGPRAARAGQVEFVPRLQLQRVVESAHHSHGEPPEHLLQDLLRQVQAGPLPGGLLPHPAGRGRPAQQQQRRQVQQQQDADPAPHLCA